MKMLTPGVSCMKISFVGVLISFVIGSCVLKFGFTSTSFKQHSLFSSIPDYSSDALHVEQDVTFFSPVPSESITQKDFRLLFDNTIFSSLFSQGNLSVEETQILTTWNDMKKVLFRSDLLPEARGGLKEAVIAWQDLLTSIYEMKTAMLVENSTMKNTTNDNQCPFSLSSMNITDNQTNAFFLQIPCGLIQDSSITVVGIPMGLLGNFKIELIGAQLPGETDSPVILHYNVRLQGDKLTENPVVVQNSWSVEHDWGEEVRCPSSDSDSSSKVDGLSWCSEQVGAAVRGKSPDEKKRNPEEKDIGRFVWQSRVRKGSHKGGWFPFIENYPFAATLWVGLEGFHMTVNGKHITSFEYRESLEPWLVSGVRIAGDVKLLSVLVSGLPNSESVDLVPDLESLKASRLVPHKKVTLFIGVFSTGNNFERRMAVRRSWMQYKAVKTEDVAVRFFVGMHKNKQVNEELWKEAETYGDIQLMPFVDYYNLISLKTIAICIYGTKVLRAKYVMKTDDDAFVRIDAVLDVINNTSINQGLLYGRIAFDSEPHREQESKWYISPEEYPHEFYPPWAHGPGYIISEDIAKFVVRGHQEKKLKLLKLEDVAMGIWIEEFKKTGQEVKYINDDRFYNTGCDIDYIVAHYQGPRTMICLWKKLHQEHEPSCCE